MKPVAYHPAAQAELEAEVLYCEGERRNAGSHARADISESVLLVQKYSAIGRKGRSGARQVVTRRYRFVVHYELLDDQIVVFAVAHPKRQPGYWHSRRPSPPSA